MFFLRTVRLSLTWLEVFTQKQHISFKTAQVPPCSGIKSSVSGLFWSTTPAKLCWLFRAVLRNLIPRNLILGFFLEWWHSFVVLNRYLRSPTPVLPPSSFILPSFVWVYIFFSTGQVLLSALSWCSACTSMSEVVFPMYPWIEMYSMSTYSSTILLPATANF